MKILWLTGTLTPDAAKYVNARQGLSGGWLIDLSKQLSKFSDIELHIATASNRVKSINSFKCDEIYYHIYPLPRIYTSNCEKDAVKWWRDILNDLQPDLINIFGTEFEVAEAFINTAAAKKTPMLLTIQGLLQRIAPYYDGELSRKELYSAVLPSEIIKRTTVSCKKKLFLRRSEKERRILNTVEHVSGRTFWDEAVMKSCNPKLVYHRLNFNLRSEFYDASKWDYDKCDKFTIFTGQATYPLKGLHQLIKAIGIVKRTYPNVKLIVPGPNAENGRIKIINGYSKYLNDEIHKNGVEKNIFFCGGLPADEVIKYMLKSNIVVIPSAIEGASATMCEAMYLGVPCIGAYRGGITELIKDHQNGFLYDYSEYSYLAGRIIQLFSDSNLACTFSKNNIKEATFRHNRERNAQEYHDAYCQIAGSTKN